MAKSFFRGQRPNGQALCDYAVRLAKNAGESKWSISDERAFMENLVSNRFYYYMVIYTLIILGAFSAEKALRSLLVSSVGLIMCVLMAIAIGRSAAKLNIILALLHRTDGHPVRIVGRIHRNIEPYPKYRDESDLLHVIKWKPLDLLGYVIPWIGCVFLVVLVIFYTIAWQKSGWCIDM